MSVTDGGLRRASQTLAMQRLALGLVEASARGARQRKPKVRQRHRPGIRLESLAREADRLTSPRLRALGSPLLGVDQREQPETSDVAVGDVRRVGPLDGLHRDPPRLVELAGEEQRLREAREDADAQDVRARPSGRDRATSVLDGRAHVAALDHRRTGDFHDRLGVRATTAAAAPAAHAPPPQAAAEPRPPGARAAPRRPPRRPAAKGARAAARTGSQRTQPRNCVSRPPQTNSRSCSTSSSATVSASPAAAAYSIASSTRPCARHQAAARRRSAAASSRPSSSCRSSPNRW